MDWPSGGSGRTQTLSSTTRASSRPRTVRRARRRSSAAQRRSSGSGVCRSTAAAASSASRCSRPPGCGRTARSGVCTSRTGPGGATGPTRTTSPGAVEPLLCQGTSGTAARAGRPAAGAADHLVRLQHGAGGGADPRRSVPAGVHAGDAAGLAGEDLGAVALRVRDQAGDQRFGQQVALIGEERGGRCRKPQGRFELGSFGRADEAGGVAPLGQALDAGFEFGAGPRWPARRGRTGRYQASPSRSGASSAQARIPAWLRS